MVVFAGLPQTLPGLKIDHVGPSGPVTLDEVILPDLQVTLSKTYRFDVYDSRSGNTGFADIPMTAYQPVRLWGLDTVIEPSEYLVFTLSDQDDQQYVVGVDPVADTYAVSNEYTVNGGPPVQATAPLLASRSSGLPLDRPAEILAHRGEGTSAQVTVKPEALPGFLAGPEGSVPHRMGDEVVWSLAAESGPAFAVTRTQDYRSTYRVRRAGTEYAPLPFGQGRTIAEDNVVIPDAVLTNTDAGPLSVYRVTFKNLRAASSRVIISGSALVFSAGGDMLHSRDFTLFALKGRTLEAVIGLEVPAGGSLKLFFYSSSGAVESRTPEAAILDSDFVPSVWYTDEGPKTYPASITTTQGETYPEWLYLQLSNPNQPLVTRLDPAALLSGFTEGEQAAGVPFLQNGELTFMEFPLLAEGAGGGVGGVGANLQLSTDADGFVVLEEPADPPPPGVTVESLIQSVTAALRQPQVVDGFVYASSELSLDTDVGGFSALHLRAPADLDTRHVSQWSLGAKDIGVETLRDWAGDLYETPQFNVPLVSGDVLSTAFSLQGTARLQQLLVRLVTTPGLNPFGDVTAEFVLTRSGAELHRASVLQNGVDASGTAGSVTPRAAVDLELIPGDYLLTATITATGAVATRLGALADPNPAHPQPTRQTGFSTEDFRLRRNGADIGVNFGLAALVSRVNLLARVPLTSSPVAGGLALSGDGFVMAAQPLAAPTPTQRVRAAVEFTVTPQAGEHLAFRFLPGGADALTVDPRRSQTQSVLEAVRGLVPGDAAARPLQLTLATLGLKQSFPNTSVPVDTRLRLELTSERVGTTSSFTATYRLYNASSGELLGEMSRTTGQGANLPRPTRLILALTSDLGSGPGTAENNFPIADFGISDGQYRSTSLTLHRWVEWRENI